MGISPQKSRKKKRKWLKDLKTEANQELNIAQSQFKSNLCSFAWWKQALILVSIITFYFVSSIALTFYQKDLILRLPFPLSIVIVHLALKFCMAGLCRYLYSKYTGEKRVTLTWNQYLSRVAVVAVVSGLDIGLSQWSLEYVSLSLYTMTKTTSTPFILFFGLLLKLEKKHWSQIIIVLLITIGLIMFTYKSTTFSFVGFLMVLTAAFFSGIRWTLSQSIMQKSKLGLENPVDFMFHIQPLMILSLLPIAIGVEGIEFSASDQAFRFHEFSTFTHTLSLMTIGGVLAFCMEVAEFMVVTFASSLTLAIVGVFKEVTILALAIVRNHNEVSQLNLCGMVICLLGIFAHVLRKSLKSEESTPHHPHLNLSSSDDEEFFRPRTKEQSPILPNEGFALLDQNSDSEEYIEMNHHHRNRTKSVNSDDYYLKETRTWTSVRDRQLQAGDANDEDTIQNQDQIVNLSDD